jgi:glycosyltransferase involved in cell wall biosynthesis
MATNLRVLLISHGFPPWETAGTEQHVERLANGLRARGFAVHVVAATRAPGRAQYAVLRETNLTRIVNNVPTLPLGQGEKNMVIERIVHREAREFDPDIVHIHHIQFLSSGLRFDAPTVVTLHDGWAWCAAGGQGIRLPEGTNCPGPTPEACARCATAWAPAAGKLTMAMTRFAALAAPIVAPEHLHRLYRRIPASMRPRPERGQAADASAADAAHRNDRVGALYRAADTRVSPSHFLAARATAHGLGSVQVIPHGFAPTPEPKNTARGSFFLHLGTIAHHKGTDRVVKAWRQVCPDGHPALRLHGPVADIQIALGHPVGPVLDRRGVIEALQGAKALVLAPRWEENAPMIIGEARAAGCPIIAPNSGGIPELVKDGVDGILYDATAPDALRLALRAALDHPLPTPRLPPSMNQQVDAFISLYRSLQPTPRRAEG